jgi:hypothetical protein
MSQAKKTFLTGIELMQNDQWDEALNTLEIAVQRQDELDSTDQLHLLASLGVAYIAAGDLDTARMKLTSAMELPASPYLPEEFLNSLMAVLDAGVDTPPYSGAVIPKGESALMHQDNDVLRAILTARGNPVTTQRIVERNVVTSAALRLMPSKEELASKTSNDISKAMFRFAEKEVGAKSQKKPWWKLW